jgi:hypothetical protein
MVAGGAAEEETMANPLVRRPPRAEVSRLQGRLSLLLATLALCVLGAAPGLAATLQGTLHYGGQPVKSTFSGYAYGLIAAYDSATATWYMGTINFASSSYSIPGVPSGSMGVRARLSLNPVGSDLDELATDLSYNAYFNVGAGPTTTQDIDLVYGVHTVSPYDNAQLLPGQALTCPYGPDAPATFTFSWHAVPLAVSYYVYVRRMGCAGVLATDFSEVTSTSIEVEQSRVAGEEYVMLDVQARDAGGMQLSKMPYANYEGGSLWETLVVRPASAGARTRHSTGSKFLIQVAHAPGVPPTFWKSDLILSNPTNQDVTANLVFTPRGADGLTTFTQTQVQLPPYSCRTVADFVDSLFHASGAGSIELTTPGINMMCRNYTPAPNPPGGAYGQGYMSTGLADATYVSGPTTILDGCGVAKGSYRTNLTLLEVWGETAEVRVRLLDSNGAQLGEKEYDVPALGNIQINDVVGALAGPSTLTQGQVTVEVVSGSGRVAACLSLVDNASQDPTTLVLVPRAE